jgi:hypothetical protein
MRGAVMTASRRRPVAATLTRLGLVAVSLLAAPVVVEAQTGKVYRIGFLSAGAPSTDGTRLEALRADLRDLDYRKGRTSSSSIDGTRAGTTEFPSLLLNWRASMSTS